MFRLLISSFLISLAVAQNVQCNAGASTGPAINNGCPDATEVPAIDPATGEVVCCPTGQTTPIVATTASSASTCVDRVNNRTGVSDCPQRANLCNDPVYFDVMTRQCPRTCNRCNASSATTATTPSGACVDLINLRTGVSDCPARRDLCRNSAYTTLMRQQCPATCGFC